MAAVEERVLGCPVERGFQAPHLVAGVDTGVMGRVQV